MYIGYPTETMCFFQSQSIIPSLRSKAWKLQLQPPRVRKGRLLGRSPPVFRVLVAENEDQKPELHGTIMRPPARPVLT